MRYYRDPPVADYASIARMESEVYGKTFRHADAHKGVLIPEPAKATPRRSGESYLARILGYLVVGYALVCLFGTLRRHPGPQFWIPWH